MKVASKVDGSHLSSWIHFYPGAYANLVAGCSFSLFFWCFFYLLGSVFWRVTLWLCSLPLVLLFPFSPPVTFLLYIVDDWMCANSCFLNGLRGPHHKNALFDFTIKYPTYNQNQWKCPVVPFSNTGCFYRYLEAWMNMIASISEL